MPQQTVEIRDALGRVIRTSKNLRGILRYPGSRSLVYIKEVRVTPLERLKGRLEVTWSDGAYAVTEFASHSVLCDWLRSRRSWYGAEVLHNGRPAGKLGKNIVFNFNHLD